MWNIWFIYLPEFVFIVNYSEGDVKSGWARCHNLVCLNWNEGWKLLFNLNVMKEHMKMWKCETLKCEYVKMWMDIRCGHGIMSKC